MAAAKKKKKMGPKVVIKDHTLVNLRIEKVKWHEIMQIAALESSYVGKTISGQDLIRDALTFVYGDNERLRYCFKRIRGPTKLGKKNIRCIKEEI